MKPIDALLSVIREEGVTKVFGNPGTTELPLTDALAGLDDIEYVLALHEGSAVAMADGYARATGRPSFLNLHIAAGLANGMGGLLNAARSRTPMVVTAGQQDRRHMAQDPMLSADLVAMVTSVVKHAVEVQHAYDLPVAMRRAFALATTPPTGPVFLSLPMDMLAEETEVDLPARSVVAPLGTATELDRAVDLLVSADRPAIVAGDGAAREDAIAELVAVAEAAGAVTYHQPMNDWLTFPQTHPLYGGPLPPSNAAIRTALDGHDLVFIVGCHAFMPHHYTPGPAIPRSQPVLQLDSDANEIGRNYPAVLGLVGGIRPTLAALADRLSGRIPGAAKRIEAAGRDLSARQADLDARARGAYGPAPMSPLAAAHAVIAGLPSDAVLIEESITTGVLVCNLLRLYRPRSYVHAVGGALGFGIGAAIGSRMGNPDRPVVAVLGDGCTMFGLQGLWSAARYQVPVTFVVMNNGEYRTLKNTLDSWASTSTKLGRYVGLDLAPPALDFTKAAEFFGVDAVRVTDADQLADVVAKAAGGTRPLLVDAPITGHRDEH